MNQSCNRFRVCAACIALLLAMAWLSSPALALSGLAGKSMNADTANETVGEQIRARADAARLSRAYEQKSVLIVGVSAQQSALTQSSGTGLDADLVRLVFEALGYHNEAWLESQGLTPDTAQEQLEATGERAVWIVPVEDLPSALSSGIIDIAAGEEAAFAQQSAQGLCSTPYLTGTNGLSTLTGESWNAAGKRFVLAAREGAQTLIEQIDGQIVAQMSSGAFALAESNYFQRTPFQVVLSRIRQALSGFVYEFERNLIREDRYKMLLGGLLMTLRIAGVSCVAGAVFGSVVALMRLSKSRLLRGISTLYVNIVRGTPVVVQLMIIYYIVLTAPSKPVAAMVTFSVNSAAYVSEMVRGGILAVDKGQTEAGRSLGLNAASTMVLIVLPQTIKIIIPSLFNEFITLLKETSVVGFIGLMDLSKAGDFIRSRTYSPFFPLLAVALIYLLLVTILTRVFGLIEGRLRKSDLR